MNIVKMHKGTTYKRWILYKCTKEQSTVVQQNHMHNWKPHCCRHENTSQVTFNIKKCKRFLMLFFFFFNGSNKNYFKHTICHYLLNLVIGNFQCCSWNYISVQAESCCFYFLAIQRLAYQAFLLCWLIALK